MTPTTPGGAGAVLPREPSSHERSGNVHASSSPRAAGGCPADGTGLSNSVARSGSGEPEVPKTGEPRPVRIQRRRTKGWRMPKGAVYVGRPSSFGNRFLGPFAAAQYREWLNEPAQTWLVDLVQRRLRGRTLACWCPLHQACHADWLLELANREREES